MLPLHSCLHVPLTHFLPQEQSLLAEHCLVHTPSWQVSPLLQSELLLQA